MKIHQIKAFSTVNNGKEKRKVKIAYVIRMQLFKHYYKASTYKFNLFSHGERCICELKLFP